MWQVLIGLLIGSYFWRYCNNETPPLGDVISPTIVISLALVACLTYPLSVTLIFTILSLFVDSIADYVMNVNDIRDPVLLFGLSHGFRQLAFVWNCYPNMSLRLVMCLTWFSTYLMFSERGRYLILGYSGVLFFTVVNAYLATSRLSLGLLLFIISDVIIVYDMMWKRIDNRPIRVLLVPLLFWLAEGLVIWEVLS